MAYTPYYAPYYRPMNYYNPAIPQEAVNMQNQQLQQMPVQQMQMVQPTPMQIQSNGGLIWVDTEEEAKNYLVAPNNVVPIFDKNAPQMYIKSADGAGMPTFKRYKLIDMEDASTAPKTPDKHACQCGKDFVRIDAFEALQGEFEALRNELEELKAKPKAKTAKKTVEEVESDE